MYYFIHHTIQHDIFIFYFTQLSSLFSLFHFIFHLLFFCKSYSRTFFPRRCLWFLSWIRFGSISSFLQRPLRFQRRLLHNLRLPTRASHSCTSFFTHVIVAKIISRFFFLRSSFASVCFKRSKCSKIVINKERKK